MFKLDKEEGLGIDMKDMRPCDIGIIVEGSYGGEIVIRTAEADNFIVMSLSEPGIDRWWSYDAAKHHKVKLLSKGTKLTLEVI